MKEAFRLRCSLYYLRVGVDEVDFVLRKLDKTVAIEVKSNSESDTHGLHMFQEKYHPVQSVIVGQNGIPAETFLSMDLQELFR